MVNLDIDRSYFEDCSGTYVKFRDEIIASKVSRSRFYSTGSFDSLGSAEVNVPFINISAENDAVDPGDEWFGRGYNLADNHFTFGQKSTCDPTENFCVPLMMTHKGYDPKDDSGVTRNHLLTAPKQAALESGDGAILSDDYHLPPNDCDNGICIHGNTITGNIGGKVIILYNPDVPSGQASTYCVVNPTSCPDKGYPSDHISNLTKIFNL